MTVQSIEYSGRDIQEKFVTLYVYIHFFACLGLDKELTWPVNMDYVGYVGFGMVLQHYHFIFVLLTFEFDADNKKLAYE